MCLLGNKINVLGVNGGKIKYFFLLDRRYIPAVPRILRELGAGIIVLVMLM